MLKHTIAPLFFFLWWLASWVVIFADDGATLSHAPPDRVGFLIGEGVVALFVGVLVWMTRHKNPIDHESNLTLKRPGLEVIGVLVYLVVIVTVGTALGLRSHVASLGLTESTLGAWNEQSRQSLILWAGYYGLFGAVIPFLAFRVWRGYSLESMLLKFPEPRKWIPYAVVTGVAGVAGFAGPEFFETSLSAHLVTVLLFSLGTFVPVMILTQSLIAPRLAIVSRSWSIGALLSGVVYGVYHLGEFYLSWASAAEMMLSAAWLTQFAFFGFLKAVTTLRTGNAWLHIFNTHTPHLAEAPEVSRVLGL